MLPIIPLYKRKKVWIGGVFLFIVVFILFFVFSGEKMPVFTAVSVERGVVTQEVSVTGKVKAADRVDLAFERIGRVISLKADVGSHVKAGDRLASLDVSDLSAQLRQAQAGVASSQALLQQYQAALLAEQAKLDELKTGTRPEEIQLAETAVLNAKKTLSDAEANSAGVTSKASVDLDESYRSVVAIFPSALNAAKDAIVSITEVQYSYYSDYNTDDSIRIENRKADAIYALFGVSGGGRWTTDNINRLSGGVYGQAQSAINSPLPDSVNTVLPRLISALGTVKIALDSVPVSNRLTAEQKKDLETRKSSLITQLNELTAERQALEVQKATNRNALVQAETTLNTAKNSLATAEDELRLKRSGSTPESIKGQEAKVLQAEANIASQKAAIRQSEANAQNIQAQIAKGTLIAPLTGTIIRKDTELGQIVAANSTVFSLISDAHYEMEAYVAEVDVAKVALNQPARVTLDAFGDDVLFEATVVFMDPAETVIDGVSTYKVTLEFKNDDERVKPGMTANIDILTARKDDVLFIPQRALVDRNGDRMVRLLLPEEKRSSAHSFYEERLVKTGLKGSDGRLEILDGLTEGDPVLTDIKE